jgi:hypothetical protein
MQAAVDGQVFPSFGLREASGPCIRSVHHGAIGQDGQPSHRSFLTVEPLVLPALLDFSLSHYPKHEMPGHLRERGNP